MGNMGGSIGICCFLLVEPLLLLLQPTDVLEVLLAAAGTMPGGNKSGRLSVNR